MFVVTVNTPGYLPMDDDPATFEDRSAAVAYAKELADEELAHLEESEDGFAYELSGEDGSYWIDSPDREHWLGLVIEVNETEDEPDEDDAFIVDRPSGGYDVSFCGKFLGNFERENRARAAVSVEMLRSRFYPSVWKVSDHGNAHAITVWPFH